MMEDKGKRGVWAWAPEGPPAVPEDRDNSVINALKRLERAGSEHSKTTQKLIEAAGGLAEHIGTTLAGTQGGSDILPRGYIIQAGSLARREAWGVYYLGHDQATRESALHFAHDIATGWLDELAEWVEAQGKENTEAAAKLDRAAKGMEAQP